jgi:hypothetical protein
MQYLTAGSFYQPTVVIVGITLITPCLGKPYMLEKLPLLGIKSSQEHREAFISKQTMLIVGHLQGITVALIKF